MPDGKPANATTVHEKDEDGSNLNAGLQEPSEQTKVMRKEAGQGAGEWDLSEENGLVAGPGDPPKGAKPAN